MAVMIQQGWWILVRSLGGLGAESRQEGAK
jgi:hypothetical protein